MKLFLMGYMGSGKSTLGKLLAKKLKWNFIDLDKYIEKQTGKKIASIFEKDGEVRFREIEHECLKKLLNKDNIVLALGGGTPCFHNNINLINQNGISVYLEANIDTLTERLIKDKNKRPLIWDLNKTELKYFIKTNLKKRIFFYKKANLSINVKNQTVKELIYDICRNINK